MDVAVHNWERRAGAAKMIDVDWRAAGRRTVKRTVANGAEPVAVVAMESMEYVEERGDDDESGSEGSEGNDEFIHIQESQEVGVDEEGEQLRQWQHGSTDTEVERRRNATTERTKAYRRKRTPGAAGNWICEQGSAGERPGDSDNSVYNCN